jgi:hypothetical protein
MAVTLSRVSKALPYAIAIDTALLALITILSLAFTAASSALYNQGDGGIATDSALTIHTKYLLYEYPYFDILNLTPILLQYVVAAFNLLVVLILAFILFKLFRKGPLQVHFPCCS